MSDDLVKRIYNALRFEDWSEVPDEVSPAVPLLREAKTRIKALEAKLATAEDALNIIDALDPEEGYINGCSTEALRGLVLRMGRTSRVALAQIKENDNE